MGLSGGRRHGGVKERAQDSGTGDGRRVVVRMRYWPWQKEVRRALIAGARYVVLACGARSGKDRFGNQVGIELLYRKCTERLKKEARGGVRMIPRVNAWMVAPTDKLWQQNWDEFLAFIPPALIVEKNKQSGLIRLRGDVCIKFKSADRPETLVSEGLDFLIVTEASRVKSQRVWHESLLPRLDSPGRSGVAILNGTPICGKGHWYRQVYDLAVKSERAAVDKYGRVEKSLMRAWKLPSSCNPEMTPEIIANLRTQMTDRAFRCEIMAEFPDEDEKPFMDAHIQALDVMGDGVMPVGVRYVKAIDIARRKDETFCTVWVPAMDGRPAQVVDGFRLLNKRLPFQIDRCVEFEEKYPGEWIIDSTGMGCFFYDQLREALPNVAIRPYVFNSDGKIELCEGLEYAVERGLFQLRRDLLGDKMTDVLKKQLSVFELDITEKNKLDYHGPGGKDDDGVMSLGLGWIKMGRRRAVHTFDFYDHLARQMG